jgi:CheY-like chemotaxis protein
MVTSSPNGANPIHSHDSLVVDHTPANLQLLSGMLKAAGYRVRVVPSGALASQSVASRVPDVILLDIHLDGHDVYRRLKAIRASKPN